MVVYDSQYRKHFKDPHWDQFAVNEYTRKLDYRIGRRSVEHFHEPWSWDSELEESSFEGSDAGRCVGHTDSSRVNERLKRTERAGQRREALKEKDVNDDERVVKIPKGEVQKKKHREKLKERQQEMESKQERHQRRKPKWEILIKNATTKNKTEIPVKKEPFVSYGWANAATIDKKYNYNVRASPNEVS